MKPIHILVLSHVFFLSGCLLGPNYHRPSVKVQSDFRGAEAQTEAASLADLPWWEVFGDPQLQDYIRIALENNKDLQLAIARVAQARAIVGIVRADLFPQIFAFGNASRTRF